MYIYAHVAHPLDNSFYINRIILGVLFKDLFCLLNHMFWGSSNEQIKLPAESNGTQVTISSTAVYQGGQTKKASRLQNGVRNMQCLSQWVTCPPEAERSVPPVHL